MTMLEGQNKKLNEIIEKSAKEGKVEIAMKAS